MFMKGLKDCYAKVILWLSSYLNVIAFVLTGGYVWLKSDNENLKKETKKVFIVALVFLCIDAFLSIYYAFMTMGNTYSMDAYDFYRVLSKLVVIGKIVTYAVCAILAFVLDGRTPACTCEADKNCEQKNSSNDSQITEANAEVIKADISNKNNNASASGKNNNAVAGAKNNNIAEARDTLDADSLANSTTSNKAKTKRTKKANS